MEYGPRYRRNLCGVLVLEGHFGVKYQLLFCIDVITGFTSCSRL